MANEASGFIPNQGVKAHGIGYVRGGCPTLRAEVVPGVVYTLQANGIDRADTARCNGRGFSESGVSYTLNTVDRHAVVYAADMRNFRLLQEKTPPLQAKPNGGISLNCTHPVLYENHAQDSRVTGPQETSPTIAAKFGTGGGNTPLVVSEHRPRKMEGEHDGRDAACSIRRP